jgi:hypothetical protein
MFGVLFLYHFPNVLNEWFLLLQLVSLINLLWGQVVFVSYMLLMSSFLVDNAKGGEVLGTKAMKVVSNTKHHQIKIS